MVNRFIQTQMVSVLYNYALYVEQPINTRYPRKHQPTIPIFHKKTKTPVKDSLALCENLLNYGINQEYCQIGASIILSSIANINVEAKYKMPYYYDAL